MRYIEIYVKSALSKSGLENTDYSLNPYRGCEHQCVYCYAPYVLHIPLQEWRNVVYVKRNLPTVMDRELKRKKGFITVGSVTDAYQPAERKYEITRKSLEVLLKHNARISILTKSSLILRDRDIISKFREAHVGVTLTTLDDAFRRRIEPNSSSVEERLQVLEEFKNKAIRYIFVGPIFPEITLPHLREIVKMGEKLEVDYMIFDRFRWKRDMHLPPWLQKYLRGADYAEIKKEVLKIARESSIPIYFDW